MDILETLDRCAALERGAGEVYVRLAERFQQHEVLRGLWRMMAADEEQHARTLCDWRGMLAALPAERRPVATGFREAIEALEPVMLDVCARAGRCTTAEEAFALALQLELSELDAMYTRLRRSIPPAVASPTADLETRGTTAHHAVLVRAVRAQSRDEQNLLRASLLAGEDAR